MLPRSDDDPETALTRRGQVTLYTSAKTFLDFDGSCSFLPILCFPQSIPASSPVSGTGAHSQAVGRHRHHVDNQAEIQPCPFLLLTFSTWSRRVSPWLINPTRIQARLSHLVAFRLYLEQLSSIVDLSSFFPIHHQHGCSRKHLER